MHTPKRKSTTTARCPESGRTWNRLSDYDECPHCGRMVRAKGSRWETKVTPAHDYPKNLRH